MALIELPPVDWSVCEFDPIRPRDFSRMEGRRTESQSTGTPYWISRYQAGRLEQRDYGVFDAFIMQAGVDGDYFLGHDVFRPRPIAYGSTPLSGVKAGGGAFAGQGVVTALTNSRQATLGGLPAGFQLRRGDYVEFRMSDLERSLHRLTEDATADGAGVVSISFRFGLDLQHFDTTAIVNFEKPSCVMQIDPSTVRAVKSWADRSPAFGAQEVFPWSA